MLAKILYRMPRKMAHKILYYKKMKKKLNIDEPRNLNEKIQYLIVNEHGEKEALLADKRLAKGYVKKVCSDVCVPKTYKIYKNVDEIKLEDLPEQFVLKCNHCCRDVFICTSKRDFDLQMAKKMLDKALKFNFAKKYLEYHYAMIDRCILAEEYLNDHINKNPIDYKFYCYDGVVGSILVCSEREKKLKLDDFDLDWNKLDYSYEKYKSQKILEKPRNLKKMIEIASKLSKGMKFVRVDLYEINNRIYFGEFTFSPAAGLISYYKEDALMELGRRINLK